MRHVRNGKCWYRIDGIEALRAKYAWNERARLSMESIEMGQHIDFLDDFTISDVIAELPSRPSMKEEGWT